MTPQDIANLVDEEPQLQVPHCFLEQALHLLINAEDAEPIIHNGQVLLTRDERSRYGDEEQIEIAGRVLMRLEEGKVGQAESDVFRALTQLSDRLVERLQKLGLEVEKYDADHAMVLEVQVGRNQSFPASQRLHIMIYDTDDMTVEVPTEVASRLEMDNFHTFKQPQALINLIPSMIDRISKLTNDSKTEDASETQAGKLDKLDMVRKATKPPAMGGTFAPY
jgi:hypothetical protein